MKLTETDIQEFQTIIKADYGIELSYDKAHEDAQKLIQLMGIVLEMGGLEDSANEITAYSFGERIRNKRKNNESR